MSEGGEGFPPSFSKWKRNWQLIVEYHFICPRSHRTIFFHIFHVSFHLILEGEGGGEGVVGKGGGNRLTGKTLTCAWEPFD